MSGVGLLCFVESLHKSHCHIRSLDSFLGPSYFTRFIILTWFGYSVFLSLPLVNDADPRDDSQPRDLLSQRAGSVTSAACVGAVT